MPLDDPAARKRLVGFIISAAASAAAELSAVRRLKGGALQEHWLVDVLLQGGPLSGHQRLVLRTGAATSIAFGHDRHGEFALLRAIHAAGVAVPEPLFLCGDAAVIGKPFLLMRWRPGTAVPELIVAMAEEGRGEALAERLGRELATIHAIRPPQSELAFLGPPPEDAARARSVEYGRYLESCGEPRPVAEWGLRWLIRHAPPPAAPTLCHGDFRTGNYLVDDEAGLVAILDWEFASWSDPDEDIGWFCSRCWRYGATAREAGGIASRAAFHRGYETAAGRSLEPSRMRYWEVMAAMRWLIIALEQRDRALKRGDRSLELALKGRRAAECEHEILRLTREMEAPP